VTTDRYTTYLLADCPVDLTEKTITAKVRIVATTGTEIVWRTSDGNPAPIDPNTWNPFVRLEFQTTTAGAWVPTDYWWSNPGCWYLQELADNGGIEITLSVHMDPALWSDLNGVFGNDPTCLSEWASALMNAKQIGLSFGGGYRFANGVELSSGTATFELLSYVIA
jgi:hypothetical protein